MNVPSLCAVLTRALDRRTDVQKCSVTPITDRPNLINVEVFLRSGKSIKREAGVEVLFDSDRPISDTLDDWIGKEPPITGKRDVNWQLDRAAALAHTPSGAIRLFELGRRSAVPEHKPEQPENPQAPGSKLNWSDGREPIAAAPVVPDPTPATKTYIDPITNEPRPVLKRADMVKLGMTREQRHEQYKRQGGPHPDDE